MDGPLAAGVAALIAWAFLVHQPWVGGSIDHHDFPEWIPLLQRADGPFSRLGALHEYYASTYGRFIPLQLAHIVFRWPLFGDALVGWQLTSFALMAVVLALAALALRRLGADRLGALAGASLFATGRLVYESWGVRVQVIESLGVVFILAAIVLAADYQTTRRPVRSAVALSICIVLAAWVKETLVATMPFVLLTALCYSADKRWSRPALRRRDVVLIVTSAAIVLVGAVVPTLVTYANVPDAAYTGSAGRSPITPGRVVLFLTGVLYPSVWAPDAANGLFWLVIAAGVLVGWRGLARPSGLGWMSAAALSLPLCGALVYLPFKFFYDYHAMAFLFGAALLFALAITWLRRFGGSAVRRLAFFAWFLIFAALTRFSVEGREKTIAEREANAAASRAIAALGSDARVSIVGRPLWAQHVAAYSRWLLHADPPQLRDATCAEVLPRLTREQTGGEAVAIFQDRCGSAGSAERPDVLIERLAAYPTSSFAWRSDTVRVRLWLPPSGPDGLSASR